MTYDFISISCVLVMLASFSFLSCHTCQGVNKFHTTLEFTSVNSLFVLQNSTTARKGGNALLTYLKAFFVRHESEYVTSDSDLKVNRTIYPDAVSCDRMRLIGPKCHQLGPINLFTWRVPIRKQTRFASTRLNFESWCKQSFNTLKWKDDVISESYGSWTSVNIIICQYYHLYMFWPLFGTLPIRCTSLGHFRSVPK